MLLKFFFILHYLTLYHLFSFLLSVSPTRIQAPCKGNSILFTAVPQHLDTALVHSGSYSDIHWTIKWGSPLQREGKCNLSIMRNRREQHTWRKEQREASRAPREGRLGRKVIWNVLVKLGMRPLVVMEHYGWCCRSDVQTCMCLMARH